MIKIKIEEWLWDSFIDSFSKEFESDWIVINEERLECFLTEIRKNENEIRHFKIIKNKNYQEQLDRVYE